MTAENDHENFLTTEKDRGRFGSRRLPEFFGQVAIGCASKNKMQHFCNSSPFFFNGIYPFQMPLKKRWTQCRVGSYPPTPPLDYTVALASATPTKSSQNVPIIPTNTAPRLRSFFNFTKKTNFTLSLQNVKNYVHNVTFMIIFFVKNVLKIFK